MFTVLFFLLSFYILIGSPSRSASSDPPFFFYEKMIVVDSTNNNNNDNNNNWLRFREDGSFKIVQFTDLHFGEGEDQSWGAIQDLNSTRFQKTSIMEFLNS